MLKNSFYQNENSHFIFVDVIPTFTPTDSEIWELSLISHELFG